jgi:uncharacterized protein
MYRTTNKIFSAITILALMLMALPMQSASAVSTSVVISQFQVAGTTAADEFVEIHNVGTTSVDLNGHRLVYRSAAGTSDVNMAAWTTSTIIPAGGYYLIAAAPSGATPVGYDDTVTPDVTYTHSGTGSFAAAGGGFAIRNGAVNTGTVIDSVGYGTATNAFVETAVTTAPASNASRARKSLGCQDTDHNSSDFDTVNPSTPRNMASPVQTCVIVTTPNLSINEVSVNEGNSGTTSFDFTVSLSAPAGAGGVTFDIATADNTATIADSDYTTKSFTGQTIPSGSSSYTFSVLVNGDTTVEPNETFFVNVTNVTGANVTDGQGQGTIQNDDTTTSNSEVVISQVYGGGGNAGATLKNDFIELYNRSASPVDLTGWSVQYAGATGTTTWQMTTLAGTIQPGSYYLIQEAAGTGGTVDLPTPNATGSIAMGGTAGKVALVNNTTALAGTGCPFAASVVDFVGYGTTANCSETAPTGTLSNTTAALRNGNGATDTDNNSVDFTVGAPNPRNTPPPNPNLTINDVSQSEGNSGTTTFTFTVSLSGPAGAGGVSFDIATADNTATVTDNDYTANSLTGQTIPAGSSTYTFSVLVNGDTTDEGADETFSVTVTNVTGAILVDGQGLGTITNDDVNICTQTFTPIYSIQGSGTSAAITGNVTTQGVVVGDFEGTAAASGFYLQDLSGDANAATSDGIFVFTGSSNLVNAGDVVRVTGFARERFNLTAINGSDSNNAAVPAANIINCGTGSVAATDVTMPFSSATFPERYEGMLVRFPQPLVIAEYFNYDRFGEIVLALPLDGESRPFSGTAIDEPGAAANARTAANALRRITLDDVQSAQNPATLRHPNGQPFSLTNRFRGGDLVQNAVGVLGFDFSLYRIIPTGPADYTSVNSRPTSPEPVGGAIRVAAMNTLNFFVTLDAIDDDPPATDNPADNVCGGNANLECRGADLSQSTEFTRQRDKLLTALSGLNADVIGLNELENTPNAEPLQSITSGMPGYAYINTGTIGTDAIKVGIIYRPAVVTPVGAFQILDSTDDPRFIDTRSRPSLAQTFEVNATGARFTIVVNHLKSKGSACSGDPDLNDGQGNCSQTRRAAAEALVDWLATDPTGSGDPDFIIMGDLNSYAMEDTIDEIKAGSDDIAGTGDDFTNLIAQFQGTYAYSYTFDGQAGYLDHALANTSLASQVTGATEWHINSDEPDVLDYDTSFKPASQEALYEVNQYRTSDHDAVVVGLDLKAPPVANNDAYTTNEDTTLNVAAPGVLGNDTDPNNDELAAVLVSSTTKGTLVLNADGSFSYAPNANYNGSDSFTYKANDGLFNSNVATVTITVNAVNDAPVAVNDSATIAKNGSGVIFILTNDSDVDGDTLTVSSFTQPAHGTVTYSTKNKNFRYTPTRGFSGTDTFSYTISDGHGGTATATVTITVQ